MGYVFAVPDVLLWILQMFPMKSHVNCRSVAHLGPKGHIC